MILFDTSRERLEFSIWTMGAYIINRIIMTNPIEQNAAKIVLVLAESAANDEYLEGGDLAGPTKLEPEDLNDAVDFLSERELVERINFIGTAPYRFGGIKLTSRGRYVYHELKKPAVPKSEPSPPTQPQGIIRNQPLAAGSPYGFTYQDWDYVQLELAETKTLKVVFGFQFSSSKYDTSLLSNNIKIHCDIAVRAYNDKHREDIITLNFLQLGAAYGEHLFNHIAREIISADIAIFDTSDRNPNVMLEMGVALTWGKRVLPILERDCEQPPSDISGHTYARYTDSGKNFLPEHERQMLLMVERAIQNKTKLQI
jgi:hypothetical protein